MKFTKMSLVAALLVGSSAFAIDNVKVSGDAKLYYATDDAKKDGIGNAVSRGDDSLFAAGSSAGQAALGLGVTADLAKGISAGAHVTVLTTLGLQGQLVNNVWEQTNVVTDSYIVDEAWLAATLGKTTVKIGRMELDTPIVFSEKWSIIANTFEAAVVINQDIPDTTLVGAYVGGSNSQAVGGTGGGIGGVINKTASESTFSQFYKGAYAAGVINNSFKPLVAQAWYYNASTDEVVGANNLDGVEAYWLQADLSMEGVMAGAQYTDLKLQLNSGTLEVNTNAYAVMLGYEGMKDLFTAKVSYSSVDKDHSAAFNLAGTGQSKLYTEAWWNYGSVTAADTDSFNVTITSPVNGMFDLGVYYTDANQDAATGNGDMTEITVTASKTVGPLDATLAFINTSDDSKNIPTGGTTGDDFNTIQAYLTLNF
ncbi:MAG: hypothetical protein QM497_01985 [Sulfurimonas sp.]